MNTTLTLAAQLYSYQYPALIAWIVACNLAIICNILILIVVTKNKNLHTKSHFLVASLCVAEIIENLAWETSAIKRIIIYIYNLSEDVTQFACIWQVYPINIGPMLVDTLAVALCVDRFLAIVFSLSYNYYKTIKYVLIVNVICLIYSIGMGSLSFYGYQENNILHACTYATAFNQNFYNLYNIQQDIKVGLSGAIDLITLLVLWRRLRVTRKMPPQQRREARLKLELGTIRTLIVLSFVYLICFGLASLCHTFVFSIGGDLTVKVAPVITLFSMVNVISHLFVYLIMSKTFRFAFRNTFNINNTLVEHVNINS